MAKLDSSRLLEIKDALLADFSKSTVIAGMGYKTVNRQECLMVYLMRARGSYIDVPLEEISQKLAALVPEMPTRAVKDPEYYNFLN